VDSSRRWVGVGAAAAAVLALTSCAATTPTSSPADRSTSTPTVTAAAKSHTADPTTASPPGGAAALLATLPVKGRAPMTGYDRELFGTPWSDVDDNGCDTRDDVLARDPRSAAVRAGVQLRPRDRPASRPLHGTGHPLRAGLRRPRRHRSRRCAGQRLGDRRVPLGRGQATRACERSREPARRRRLREPPEGRRRRCDVAPREQELPM